MDRVHCYIQMPVISSQRQPYRYADIVFCQIKCYRIISVQLRRLYLTQIVQKFGCQRFLHRGCDGQNKLIPHSLVEKFKDVLCGTRDMNGTADYVFGNGTS
jgi:hypothetical protein